MLTRAEAAAHEARDGRWPEAPAEVVLLKCRLVAVHDELPTGRRRAHEDGAARDAAEHALGARVDHCRVGRLGINWHASP